MGCSTMARPRTHTGHLLDHGGWSTLLRICSQTSATSNQRWCRCFEGGLPRRAPTSSGSQDDGWRLSTSSPTRSSHPAVVPWTRVKGARAKAPAYAPHGEPLRVPCLIRPLLAPGVAVLAAPALHPAGHKGRPAPAGSGFDTAAWGAAPFRVARSFLSSALPPGEVQRIPPRRTDVSATVHTVLTLDI